MTFVHGSREMLPFLLLLTFGTTALAVPHAVFDPFLVQVAIGLLDSGPSSRGVANVPSSSFF